jgi:hypothetical protein
MHAGRLVLSFTLASALASCAAVQLDPGAEKIRLTNQEPKGCTYLGEVVGTQGNSLTAGGTSNENLAVGVSNSMKNKAAAMGGNVIHVLATSLDPVAGATGQGVVYRCPETP